MNHQNIRYSRRSCYVYNEQNELVGKIQWQRDRAFKVWKIHFLSEALPIFSYDSPEVVREKLEQHNYSWRWSPIRHYYSYRRF